MSENRPLVGRFDELNEDEPYPGVHRRVFDGERATVTQYEFDPGAEFPLHRHPQEQITLVEDGTVVFTVGGRPNELQSGGWSIVGPNVEHGLRAGAEGARILAVLVPRREGANEYELLEGPNDG
jgi:quercetin dioxygenase-like cupin family protein